MFTSRKRGSGNKYIFIIILMVFGLMYILGRISPQKEASFPDIIQYNGLRYQYMETAKGSPFMFVRSKPAGREGLLILARRGIRASEEIYIYEGNLKYRRYVVLIE